MTKIVLLIFYLSLSINQRNLSAQPGSFQGDKEIIEFLNTCESDTVTEPESLLRTLYHITIEIEDKRTQGQAYYRAANLLGKIHNRDSSILLLTKSTILFNEIKDSIWLAQSKYQLSYNHLILGNYDKSLNAIQESYNLSEKIQDTTLMAKALTWKSIVHHDIQDYDNGIKYGKEAYNLARNIKSKFSNIIARSLNAIAINYDDSGNPDMAIKYHMKVLDVKDNLSDTTRIASTYNNLGNSLMKKGNYKLAEYYFNKNLKINLALNNKYSLATVYTNLGTASYDQGDFDKAAKYLSFAEKLAFEITDVEKIQDILYQQYVFNKLKGDYSGSLKYFEKYSLLKDSLLSIEKTKLIQELETKYQSDKKERKLAETRATIALQEVIIQRNIILIIAIIFIAISIFIISTLQRNRLIKKHLLSLQELEINNHNAQLAAIIKSQETERSRFAKDLHDGFSQLISILKLNIDSLNKKNNDSINNDQVNLLFKQSNQILTEMNTELRAICFNLMPKTLQELGLIEALNEFANRIKLSSGIYVEVIHFGFKNRFENQHEIALYRIIQEWINNIIKYAMASKITINLTKDEQEFTIIIEDDGLGFNIKNLASSDGHGWKNIVSRSQLINATVNVDSSIERKGTTFILETVE